MPKALTERLAGEPDDARVRDESSRWVLQSFLFSVAELILLPERDHGCQNWRMWIGKPDLSALSGVSPGKGRCTEPATSDGSCAALRATGP